jgi:hypothetical protein
MAKTLRTSGDYTIKTGAGYNSGAGTNTIDLDSKIVRVRGDLVVDGDQVVQNVTNITVEDQFLELNRNYSLAGAEDAGIVINQGTQDAAIFYYDGTANEFRIGTTARPIADGSTTKWQIDGGAFALANIKVATTPTDANHAASRAYVDAQVVGAGGMTNFSIVGDDSTGVTVGDGDDVKIAGGSNISAAVAEPDTITISLKNDLSDITSVTSDASNSNLTLKANGTGSISINNILTFSSNASTPAAASVTKLYSKTVGGGGTGVFFINSAVGSGTEDELISKKKATALAIALG